jgi:hypothetical protein
MEGLIPASGNRDFAQFLVPGESSKAARESRQGRRKNAPRDLFNNSGGICSEKKSDPGKK